ncbi:hypothetical protein EZ449_14250 [Pedobacter frigidisoli]|uniref:Uncharacterized protein n=1 Tax=Pedobacter frigidisoli TaxID=2530455 RepID=A0A4R0P5I9_9SPHI|nr:hypothetical protein [Pedobacter frigidisoli]TCD07693.1 hypothetical protein EZ449_14250 [Pedobacter frigidisoli]
MKKIILLLTFFLAVKGLSAQRTITDRNIINQQERMVFKSWDPAKFTPTPGFLGLNPEYWLTWALHPNYPKTDLRPLSPFGPQTQRISLVLAMGQTDNAYKRHSDTLAQTAAIRAAGHLGALSPADPLWQLYYSAQLSELINGSPRSALDGLDAQLGGFLVSSGLYSWYTQERESLLERLEIIRNADMERGSRIMGYHRLLSEYRKLKATWQQRKSAASKQVSLSGLSERMHGKSSGIRLKGRSDIEIADEILAHSKL